MLETKTHGPGEVDAILAAAEKGQPATAAASRRDQ